MGVEARYHAVPEDWHVLRAVSHNARFANYLQFLDSYLKQPAFRLGANCFQELDPEEEEFVVAVQSLKATRPGIEQRISMKEPVPGTFYPTCCQLPIVTFFRLVKAASILLMTRYFGLYRDGSSCIQMPAPTQGIPYQFLGAADTIQAYRLLLAVQSDVLKTFYYTKVMRHLGVYKALDVDFEFIWQAIQELRHFYAQTASAGEGTLVVID